MGKRSYRGQIGLALGGGGTRGIAHVGVLRVLEREGIPVDLVAGTSVGGAVAALYALGLSAADIEAEILRLGQLRHFVSLLDWSLGAEGLFQGRSIYDYLVHRFGSHRTFADLPKPLAVTAVDLISGQPVILNSGSVADAVRATFSIPGIFAPVHRDGLLLIDGGVLNNVPVDVARRMGAHIVIGVDVGIWHSYAGSQDSGPDSLLDGRRLVPTAVRHLWRSLALMMAQQVERNLQEHPPDVLVRPQIPGEVVFLAGIQRVPELVLAGERAMEEMMPHLRAILAQSDTDH